MGDVETRVHPPDTEPEDDGEDLPSTRVSAWIGQADGTHLDAAVQLFDTDATDPGAIADALLRTALAAANLAGADVAWAAMRRFTDYGHPTDRKDDDA